MTIPGDILDRVSAAGGSSGERAEGGGVQLPDQLPPDPFPTFQSWFDEAHARRVQPNPNAMTLATIEPDGRPSARIVLCKDINPDAGYIVFYTNYHGGKGRALEANPRAAVVFHWDALDRQVRLEGPVTKSPAAESDAYFLSRPWPRQIGAWASDQSQPIPSRADLVEKLAATLDRFGINPLDPPPLDAHPSIPRPPHWGGFRLWADRVELWVGSSERLHDRAVWTRSLTPAAVDGAPGFVQQGGWAAQWLQP